MRNFNLEISEQNFNLIWRGLAAQEEKLLKVIEEHDDESELAAFASNDLIYLRLYKDQLQKAASVAAFSPKVFKLTDDVIAGLASLA